MNMFDYSNVGTGIIKSLPEEIQEKVVLKKEDDLQKSRTVESDVEKKLGIIKKYFNSECYGKRLLLSIINFIETKGTEKVVRSEEFKEMALIAAIGLLLKDVRNAKELKDVNSMLKIVLGISIGESEPCRKVFLSKDSFIAANRSMIPVDHAMKGILSIVEELSITKKEYLLALEQCVIDEEHNGGLWRYTLEARAFLEIEKKKNGIESQFDFSEYKKAADEYLKAKNNIYMAAEMYRFLKKAGYILEDDRDQVLRAYESGRGRNEDAATKAAKKAGLIPYASIFEKIKAR